MGPDGQAEGQGPAGSLLGEGSSALPSLHRSPSLADQITRAVRCVAAEGRTLLVGGGT